LTLEFTGEQEVSVYLKEIEDKLYSLSVKKALSYRNQFLGENHISPFMIDRERNDLLLRPELYETLMAWKNKSKDKLLRRKVDLLAREILKAKVAYEPEIFRLTNKINKKIQSFTPNLNGTDMTRNQLDDIIRKSPDRNLRERAWWAEISFGEQIEREVITLIKLRNQKARELGYNQYGEMCLILEDIKSG
jgi:oligoendopeptidase F